MTGPRRSQRGATFIEVLVAVGIFSIVTIGVSPALLSAQKFADMGKNQSIATALAQDKIEEIRRMAAGSLASGSDGPLNASGGTTGGIFGRSWGVTANSPMSGSSRVVVNVAWNQNGRPHSVRLVTLALP
jgi:type II secretory pathway pseudopilin PulG